jgi:hypothetical protein
VLAQLLAPTVEQAKTSVEFEVVDLVSTWWRCEQRPSFSKCYFDLKKRFEKREIHLPTWARGDKHDGKS